MVFHGDDSKRMSVRLSTRNIRASISSVLPFSELQTHDG